jgi:hypothetical protein
MSSFFKSSKKAEDVKQGGSNHITASGVYPVMILAPIVSVSKNGSTSIDMYLEHKGQKQVIYGNLRITNNDGSDNKIGSKVFNQLLIIAGKDEVSDPIEVELPIGKKEAMKEAAILEDLADIPILMRIQMEYSVYNGKIQEKKVIKAFFRESDNASAEEIVNESDAGESFEKEMKYVDNVTYKDDLTPETIQAWIAGGRKDGLPAGSSAGSSSEPAKKPAFGKRRFGADKE